MARTLFFGNNGKILKHRLQAALFYWIVLPLLVCGSGLLLDRVAGLQQWPVCRIVVAVSLVLSATGVLVIGLADHGLRRHGHGTASPARPPRQLVRQGIYRLCRHPMFFGYDLAALAVVLLWRSPAMLLVSFPVFLCWQLCFLYREERILRLRFGDEYESYCREVPLLIPSIVNLVQMR